MHPRLYQPTPRYLPSPAAASALASAYSTAYMCATLAKACLSPARTMLPASQLRGLSASGAASSAITARQAACRLQAGDHSFFKMSRQISPVCFWGWGVRLGGGGYRLDRHRTQGTGPLVRTDLKVDVGVEDARDEAHGGGADRVLLPHLDADLEAAALEGRVGGPADECLGMCACMCVCAAGSWVDPTGSSLGGSKVGPCRMPPRTVQMRMLSSRGASSMSGSGLRSKLRSSLRNRLRKAMGV